MDKRKSQIDVLIDSTFDNLFEKVIPKDSNDISSTLCEKQLKTGNVYKLYRKFSNVYSILGIHTITTYTHRRMLKYYKFDPLNRAKETPLRVYLIYIFLFYVFVKNVVITILQIGLFKSISKWKPNIINGSIMISDECAYRQDIYEPDIGVVSKIEQHYRWLQRLGSPISVENEIVSTVTLLLLGMHVVLYFFRELCQRNKFYLDVVSFIEEPNEERKRIRTVAMKIIDNLQSFDEVRRSSRHKSQGELQRNPDCVCKFEHRESQIKLSHSIMSQGRKSFFEFPSSLTAQGYEHILKQQAFNLLAVFILNVFTQLISIYYPIRREIQVITQQHLEYINCNRLNPNATVIKDPSFMEHLRPEEARQERDVINRASDPYSPLCQMLITYNILKPAVILYTLEKFMWLQSAYSWFLLVEYNRSAAFISTLHWAERIETKLRCCSQMMSILSKSKPVVYRQGIKKLEQALISTYVDFELFRTEYHTTRKFLSFLTSIFVTTRLVAFAGCFMLSTFASTGSISASYVAFTAVIALNFDFVVAILTINSISRIFQLVHQVVGKAAGCSMTQFHIIQLWQQRILYDDYVKHLFAIKAYGIHLEMSDLITLNSYIVGAALFTYSMHMRLY